MPHAVVWHIRLVFLSARFAHLYWSIQDWHRSEAEWHQLPTEDSLHVCWIVDGEGWGGQGTQGRGRDGRWGKEARNDSGHQAELQHVQTFPNQSVVGTSRSFSYYDKTRVKGRLQKSILKQQVIVARTIVAVDRHNGSDYALDYIHYYSLWVIEAVLTWVGWFLGWWECGVWSVRSS